MRHVIREIPLTAGQIIFQEGDEGDGIYMVKAGKVQISAMVGQERRPISLVGEGDMFGEMAVMDNERRSATASAEVETVVYFIPRDEMLKMLSRSPGLAQSLVREISRRLREFNRQYMREVIQSERLVLVGRFARSIVHDLKNPLNIIGIAADMSGLETATPAMRISAKQRIRKQVERISNMVNELLEFTRTSQTSVVLATTDYAAFVLPLIEEIRAEVSVKNTTVECENNPPSAKIGANPQRLARVFYNLMHNATDAMPGGGKITVRFTATDKEIVTEIEDSGPGIPTDVIGHLFEPFFTHGKAHGTGLGLSICKRIIEDHQGRMQARNSPRGGAIFEFTLPTMPG
jgi:signal transduction histidine kinase